MRLRRSRLRQGEEAGHHAGESEGGELLGGERLDHGHVVGHGREFHLGAQLVLQIFHQRRRLARQFGGRFIRDGRDLEDCLCLRQAAQGENGAGEHRFDQGAGRRG